VTVAEKDHDLATDLFLSAVVVGVDAVRSGEIGRAVSIEVGEGGLGRRVARIERRTGHERRLDDSGPGRPAEATRITTAPKQTAIAVDP
jgi:hypothetical protein